MISDNKRAVVALALSGLFFPLGYWYCASYHSMNKIIASLMTLTLVIIFILLYKLENFFELIFFFNMLTLAYIFGYIAPLLKKGIFKRENSFFYKKISFILLKIFILIAFLLPMSLMPIHVFFADGDIIKIIYDSQHAYVVSYKNSIFIIALSVFWYVLAIVNYCVKGFKFIKS